ncbi:MAG: AAA family ATPase [Spirochaetales bacterium]|nr:AAA family ATPase [Spirochaetales bacterium]
MKFERTVGKELLRLAGQYPVVTVTGPGQSGKTTLCKHTFPDYSYVSLEDFHVREFALKDPVGSLDQFENSVVIDEVQNVPKLLSSIQTRVDSISGNGQFILTGSSQFGMTASISQSLAGRTAMVNLLPLSYSELYSNEDPELDEVLYMGFYPRIFDQNLDPAEMYSFYVQTYIERDVRQILNVQDSIK